MINIIESINNINAKFSQEVEPEKKVILNKLEELSQDTFPKISFHYSNFNYFKCFAKLVDNIEKLNDSSIDAALKLLLAQANDEGVMISLPKKNSIIIDMLGTHPEVVTAKTVAKWIAYNKVRFNDLALTQEQTDAILPNLTYLEIVKSGKTQKELEQMFKKCTQLETLILNEDSIEEISNIPPSIRNFNCSGSENLKTVKDLPSNLRTLSCDYCPSLVTIPEEAARTAGSFSQINGSI